MMRECFAESFAVTEGQFWKELRSRINQRSHESAEKALPGYCEWLEQRSYSTNGRSARITGRALFDGRIKKASWRFTLILDHAIPTFDEYDWAELEPLLPDDCLGDWLQVEGERLTIALPA